MKRARARTARAKRRLPFLRRLGRSNRLFPRKLQITREGKYLVALVLGVGFAAVNTGNNLLYLVLALMLSLIITSGVLSELTLRKVTAELRIPPHAHARRPHLVRVAVQNAKRVLSSFSVRVELVCDDARVTQRAAYLIHLQRKEARTAHLKVTFAERGRYTFAGVRVATRYPFGFFLKSRFFPQHAEVVVYPAMVDVVPPALSGLRELGATLRPMAGRGDEYYALRELRSGDDARDIYWKATAKLGEPVVRDFEEPVRRRVTLCFANVSPDEERATLEGLERAIEVTASLAAGFVETGSNVGLATVGHSLAPDIGLRHLHALLRHLALLEIYVPESGASVSLPAAPGAARVLVRHAAQRAIPLAGARFDALHEVRDTTLPAGRA